MKDTLDYVVDGLNEVMPTWGGLDNRAKREVILNILRRSKTLASVETQLSGKINKGGKK